MRSRVSGNNHRLAALTGLLLGLPFAAPCAEAVKIDALALEMKARDADVLIKKYSYDTSSFPVSIVEADGKRLTGRIEVKGETARILDKKGVLIKLDAGQKWHGHSRISLNAMATDLSMMREWLSWNMIYALGAPAPETGYLTLSINGQPLGLYYRIEWVGPQVFERYGFGKDGEMFDPADRPACADLSLGSVRDPEHCWGKISPRNNDFTPLIQLVTAIKAAPVESFHEFLANTFDIESVINWIAVTVLVENTTTYNNEYWPYLSKKTGRWVIMSWDYDRTFGRNADPFLPYPRNRLNDNFQYYYGLEVGALNPLRDKLLKNPHLSRRLKQRIAELVEGDPEKAKPWQGWFAPARMQGRISELRTALLPEIALDPLLADRRPVFEEEVAALRHYVDARVHYLKRVVLSDSDWVRDRASAPLPAAGERVTLTDGWGFLLADLTVRKRQTPGKIEVKVRRGRPELAPRGISRSACIQRTWILTASGARDTVEADVTLEYLDENSRFREVGARVTDERQLTLFLRGAEGWQALPAVINPLANTLQTNGLRLPRRERLWLVACEGVPAETVAARN